MPAPRQHLLEAYDLTAFAIVKMTDSRNAHTDPELIENAERIIRALSIDAERIWLQIKKLEMDTELERLAKNIAGDIGRLMS